MKINNIALLIWEEQDSNKQKNLVFVAIFVILGLFNVISSYFLPEILKMNDIPAELLPEPTALTTMSEVLDNYLLLGTFIIILASMQIFSKEIESGIIYYKLARPITRSEYTVAKILNSFIVVIISTMLGIVINTIYTLVLFGAFESDIEFISIMLAFILFYLVITAITALFSTRFSSLNTAMLSIFSFVVMMLVAMLFMDFQIISPYYQASQYGKMLQGTTTLFSNPLAIVISISWIIMTFWISVVSLKRMDL